jgi:HD-GYP domain-containing protein (c-di-GMP phosphodiesterase class II)
MSNLKTTSKNTPFHLYLSYFFVGLVLFFGAVSTWYFQSSTERLLLNEAREHFENINTNATNHINDIYKNAANSVELLAEQRLIQASTLNDRLGSLPYLVTALRSQPNLSALYIGYENGDFFLLRPWQNEVHLQEKFQAPKSSAWLAQSIETNAGHEMGTYLFFDQNLKLLEKRIASDYRFDPRQRTWYQHAKTSHRITSSSPYVFFSTGKVGVSISKASENQGAVVGADLRLETLQANLLQYKGTSDSRFLLLTAQQEVLGSSKGMPSFKQTSDESVSLPKLADFDGKVMGTLRDQYSDRQNTFFSFSAVNDTWEGMIKNIAIPGGEPLQFWAAAPHAELLAPAIAIRNQSLLISALLFVVSLVCAYWLSRKASRPLAQLNDEALRIARFDFSQPTSVTSNITEIVELTSSMQTMKTTIEQFLELSQALAQESNFQKLLGRIVSDMCKLTHAHGGMIYLAEADERQFKLAHVQWGNLTNDAINDLPHVSIQSDPQHPLMQMLVQQQELAIVTQEQAQHYFPFIDQQEPKPASPMHVVLFPLKNKKGEMLGLLSLALDKEQALNAELMAFARALSTSASIALNTQRLADEQKILINAIIELLAGAIDAKSPYTGGHCQRVPVITTLLAEAACATTAGAYANFNLDDDEREALRIACWLHDCGKITTPEFVIDKATKLESLYDRIHEVRMRFEVLKRDAELEYFKALMQDEGAGESASADTLKQKLVLQLNTLDEEFAFVAMCNEGGEFLSQDKIERLKQIAQRTWFRTLDDNLGISHEEKARKSQSENTDPNSLPVLENLLVDKPEHLHIRSPRDQIAADNKWGFKMKVPELLYNRGELYNLSVSRGTLSEEERYKINEHMVQTIKMLDKLPFPRHLRQVPEIAGGHHEKMDGTGYPKQLKRDDMSPLARMMAIADIFEALTAVDRPYKKGKLLSEAIKIMSFMKKDQHIDAELFDLFLSSGVYLDYARQFMRPEQIDHVDLHLYLPESSATS